MAHNKFCDDCRGYYCAHLRGEKSMETLKHVHPRAEEVDDRRYVLAKHLYERYRDSQRNKGVHPELRFRKFAELNREEKLHWEAVAELASAWKGKPPLVVEGKITVNGKESSFLMSGDLTTQGRIDIRRRLAEKVEDAILSEVGVWANRDTYERPWKPDVFKTSDDNEDE